MGFRIRNEIGDRIGRYRRMYHQQVWRCSDERYRSQVFEYVVVELLSERWAQHDARGIEEQRVSVRLRLSDVICTDVAVCTGLVIDDHARLQLIGKLLREQSCHEIGRRTRSDAEDHGD